MQIHLDSSRLTNRILFAKALGAGKVVALSRSTALHKIYNLDLPLPYTLKLKITGFGS